MIPPAFFLAGGFLIVLLITLWMVAEMFRNAPDAPDKTNWRGMYHLEQARFNRLCGLMDRLLDIDTCSPAARGLELRAIEKEYRAMTGPGEPTRRREP